jgi:DNA-binding protein H-NS
MKTYQQIQEEITALQKRAETAKAKEAAEVVSRVKEAIAVYGITAQDLGLTSTGRAAPKTSRAAPAKRRSRPAKARQPKYRDEAGNVWGGRGPRPFWLRTALSTGKALGDFAVA